MKHLRRATLMSLFAAIAIAATASPSRAATTTLYFEFKTTPNNNIRMGVDVHQQTGSSFWHSTYYYCNGPSGVQSQNASCGPYFGPGDASTTSLEERTFFSLSSGNYTLYAIVQGTNTSSVPYTPWYISTGDTYYTIP